MISKTRSHLNKNRRVSRRLSYQNILQEGGQMKWETYSKGSREQPIEKILKPLCLDLHLKTPQGKPSIIKLQSFINNDDVNFVKNLQGKKKQMLKKTTSKYLADVDGVFELIKKLQYIKIKIESNDSAIIMNHKAVLKKVEQETQDDG
jgi:hypothetical protein